MSYGSSQYGSFRWGSATPAQRTTDGRRGVTTEPDEVTPKEAYGSGWKLAGNSDIEAGRAKYPFDYVVNSDGDFVTVSGFRFLMQGIARRFVGEASQLLGQVYDVDTKADLELAVARIASQDDRVSETRDVTVQRVRNAPDTITVAMTIVGERADRVTFAAEPPATPPTE